MGFREGRQLTFAGFNRRMRIRMSGGVEGSRGAIPVTPSDQGSALVVDWPSCQLRPYHLISIPELLSKNSGGQDFIVEFLIGFIDADHGAGSRGKTAIRI